MPPLDYAEIQQAAEAFRDCVRAAIASPRDLAALLASYGYTVSCDYSRDSLVAIQRAYAELHAAGRFGADVDKDRLDRLMALYTGECLVHRTGAAWTPSECRNDPLGYPMILRNPIFSWAPVKDILRETWEPRSGGTFSDLDIRFRGYVLDFDLEMEVFELTLPHPSKECVYPNRDNPLILHDPRPRINRTRLDVFHVVWGFRDDPVYYVNDFFRHVNDLSDLRPAIEYCRTLQCLAVRPRRYCSHCVLEVMRETGHLGPFAEGAPHADNPVFQAALVPGADPIRFEDLNVTLEHVDLELWDSSFYDELWPGWLMAEAVHQRLFADQPKPD